MHHGLLALLALSPAAGTVQLGPATLHRVHLVLEVEARGAPGACVEEARVHVTVPSSDDRQEVMELVFDPPLAGWHDLRKGPPLGVWELGALRAGDTRRLGYSVLVRTRAVRHRPDPESLADFGGIPQDIREQWLDAPSDPLYSQDDPAIRELAAGLRAQSETPIELLRRINALVGERLEYERDGRWDTASETLARGRGSCSEYHYLFLGICRAAGLPGRFAAGSVRREQGPVYEDTVFHRWSEVWLPGHGWFPVDAQANDVEDPRRRERSFGALDSRLLVTMKGDHEDGSPLAAGYISAATGRAEGRIRLIARPRFVWESPHKEPGAAAEAPEAPKAPEASASIER